jgi:hypothetical protein
LVFGAAALLALGLFMGGAAPARADAPFWAQSRSRQNSSRSDYSRRDYRHGSGNYGSRDRYNDDADYQDRSYDNGSGYYGDDSGYTSGRRYRTSGSNRVGYGPHDRYGDLDGDGIPNYRDPHPDRPDYNPRAY